MDISQLHPATRSSKAQARIPIRWFAAPRREACWEGVVFTPKLRLDPGGIYWAQRWTGCQSTTCPVEKVKLLPRAVSHRVQGAACWVSSGNKSPDPGYSLRISLPGRIDGDGRPWTGSAKSRCSFVMTQVHTAYSVPLIRPTVGRALINSLYGQARRVYVVLFLSWPSRGNSLLGFLPVAGAGRGNASWSGIPAWVA